MMIIVLLSVWSVGFICGLVRVGFKSKDIDWVSLGPLPILAAVFWPISLPILTGMALRKHADKRAIDAEEHKKWLEAPLP